MPSSGLGKSDLLKNADYAYYLDRAMYFNRKAKKIFSVAFIQDHSWSDLESCISEPTGGPDWHFYFNDPPSESLRSQIEESLK
jgi:hypothetical protein